MEPAPSPVELSPILHVFADLAPAGRVRVTLDVSSAQGLVWLGTQYSTHVARTGIDTAPTPRPLVERIEALAAHDALHRHEQVVREGWVFLAGRTEIDGTRREVCLPLLTTPVRLRTPPVTAQQGPTAAPPQMWIRRLGDPELTPLVADADDRARLEEMAEFGGGGLAGVELTPAYLARFPRLREWIIAVADAAGLTVVDVVPPSVDVMARKRADGLVAVVGGGLYAVEGNDEPDRRRLLRAWAGRPGLDDTALAAVYGGTPPAELTDEGVESPFPLTAAQRQVVRRARHEPLTVVSGAPGTGKSHAVAAVAVDAVLRGDSVLVATQSPHAADVLADLLDRQPGPTPLLFGNGELRSRLLDDLTDRLGQPLRSSELHRLDEDVAACRAEVGAARHTVQRLLQLEEDAASFERWEPSIPVLLADVPRVFDADADLVVVEGLLDDLARPPTGWWTRRRHRRHERRLRERTGAPTSVPDRIVRDAVGAARARRAAVHLDAHGGISIGRLWERLVDGEAALREAVGRRAGAHDQLPASWTGGNRRAVGGLLGALRAGRGQRRRQLAGLDARALARSVPLWVGNLHDIEDLLPPVAGMFDLVVLDEASQIDQSHAALALLRARRAVVVGDPHQLRHVSFTSDADVAAAVRRRDLEHLADRLDVRRSSAFDAAASSSPVTWLDEHHRSVPHLIEFSARRFYRDRVRLLTRHPSTHDADAIDVVRVDGTRGPDGVNRAEVDRVLRELDAALGRGSGTVGVVTPFRAQADAIEEEVVARVPLARIEARGLRVGTVHAFQGSERDLVLLSLALDDESPAGARRFVEDPNLCNVMVTRARERLRVITSLSAPDGLLGDYLAWADSPPSPPAEGEAVSAWAEQLARELARTGRAVAHGYPVGRWHLDLVVGVADGAVCIETRVHADGPEAHIERHLELRAAGWRLLDAFASRWGHDPTRAAIELGQHLGGPVG